MIGVVVNEGVLNNGHATEDGYYTSQWEHVEAVLVEMAKVVHDVVEVDGHGDLCIVVVDVKENNYNL